MLDLDIKERKKKKEKEKKRKKERERKKEKEKKRKKKRERKRERERKKSNKPSAGLLGENDDKRKTRLMSKLPARARRDSIRKMLSNVIFLKKVDEFGRN